METGLRKAARDWWVFIGAAMVAVVLALMMHAKEHGPQASLIDYESYGTSSQSPMQLHCEDPAFSPDQSQDGISACLSNVDAQQAHLQSWNSTLKNLQLLFEVLAVLLVLGVVGLRGFALWDRRTGCSACRKRVDRRATVCPYCHIVLTPEVPEAPARSS